MVRDAMEWLKENTSRTIFSEYIQTSNASSRGFVEEWLSLGVTRVVVDADDADDDNNVNHIGVEFSNEPKGTSWWLGLIVDVLPNYNDVEQDEDNKNLIWFYNN